MGGAGARPGPQDVREGVGVRVGRSTHQPETLETGGRGACRAEAFRCRTTNAGSERADDPSWPNDRRAVASSSASSEACEQGAT
jgi:hypothetical protein